ncbi:glycosyltransferase, partial [bacterium]|nr:glycosyltransferase [bacterium]
MSKPKVSIVTLTYNHGLFIKSALDSFINQNTDFDYEVIVSDDASQDNTQSIIMDYAKRYPNIIKPIIHKHNIGAVPNLVNALNHVKGEYLALCDGDDFWTDNSKLQKQVNFLDDNSDYSLCFHNVRIFFQDEKISDEIYPNMKSDDEITLENLIKNNFIPTNSVMYRSRVYKNIPVDILPPDWYLHLYHAKNGKIGYMPSIMAAYRRHSGGIWWDSINWPDELWIKYGNMHQRFYLELKKLFKTDKSAILSVNESLAKYLIQLADIDRRKGTKLFANAVKIDPSTVETTLQYAYEQNIKFEKYWIDSTTYIKTLIEDKESVSQELHVTKKKNEEL